MTDVSGVVIICNICETIWQEHDLVRMQCVIDGEACDACPTCGTDHHLMDRRAAIAKAEGQP